METVSADSGQVGALAARARAAQEVLMRLDTRKIADAMASAAGESLEYLARLTAGETGRGNFAGKLARLKFVLEQIAPRARMVPTRGIAGHRGGVYEIASPLGVIAGVVPFCAPSSTALFQAILGVQAGNALIFAPPVGAMRSVRETVDILEQAARKAGAPAGCLAVLDSPAPGVLGDLFRAPEVDFILAVCDAKTAALVRSSGKPGIAVEESNTPAYVDASAHVEHAARCVVASQKFDFGMACAAEEVLFVQQSVQTRLLEECRKAGGFVLSEEQSARVAPLLGEIAGLSPHQITRMAGFEIPVDVSALLAPLDRFEPDSPWARPKKAPVLPVFAVRDWDIACRQSLQVLALGGAGHTVSVHAADLDVILEFAAQMPVARILVNAPSAQGAMGWATGLAPSLMPGTIGSSTAAENLEARHFVQYKRVSALREGFSIPPVQDGSAPWQMILRESPPPAAPDSAAPSKPKSVWSAAAPPPPAYGSMVQDRSPACADAAQDRPQEKSKELRRVAWNADVPPPPVYEPIPMRRPRKT